MSRLIVRPVLELGEKESQGGTSADAPDNLALDKEGNLFITEDPGGSAPSKTLGDDVWVTRFDRDNPRRGKAVERFLSIPASVGRGGPGSSQVA